jgi:hypothetical protein
MNTLLKDFRGQVSWGRLWLGVAMGNYGASKITEMITARRTVEVAASSAPGALGAPTPEPGPDRGNSKENP